MFGNFRPCLRFPRLLVLPLLWLPAPALSAADGLTGQKIYQQKCASCHGAQGEGVADGYARPLTGDRSVAELTKIINDTMPEGEPEQCVGEEARQVAQYIYDAFYSEIAQARIRPPKIEFSRLTNRQYEHAVADLFRSFRAWGQVKEERGLKAQYYNSRGFSRDKKVIERVDPRIDFDFAEGAPDEKIGKDEFAIKWEGSILAPDTGDYEFILRTENGAKLFVNDGGKPLIDAWVRSGDGQEYRGTIRLLGGRMYPFRLEYFKYKDPRAAVRLSWKPPFHAEEIVPTRCLVPEGSSSTFVVTTPFPPDDRSTGFIRGTSVSPEWNEATTFAAIEAAKYVCDNLRELADVKRDDDQRTNKVREFCTKLAERAFRRPLTDDERRLYIDRQFEDQDNLETAVKRTVLLVLKSPRFLYREVGQGEFDDFDTASWLSFTLWDSIPDQALRDAAQRGQLKTRDQIRKQADRMAADPRTRTKVREFLHQWLRVDRVQDIVKDRSQFPEFTEQLVSDLRTSLDLLLDEIVWSESSDFRKLFTADAIPVNDRIAKFYHLEGGPAEGFELKPFQPERRAGVLSHPYVLAAFAYDQTSSPIHRGVWLSRNVLGRVLSPPPVAVAPDPPELHTGLTTRERVELQTGTGMCSKCHSMINPLGYALEEFDAVGRFREQEHGKPVDAEGHYVTRDGERVEFEGVKELANFLADSPETHRAFAERLFQHLAKQSIQAFGDERREELTHDFESGKFSIRDLVIEAAVDSALAIRELESNRTTAHRAKADAGAAIAAH